MKINRSRLISTPGSFFRSYNKLIIGLITLVVLVTGVFVSSKTISNSSESAIDQTDKQKLGVLGTSELEDETEESLILTQTPGVLAAEVEEEKVLPTPTTKPTQDGNSDSVTDGTYSDESSDNNLGQSPTNLDSEQQNQTGIILTASPTTAQEQIKDCDLGNGTSINAIPVSECEEIHEERGIIITPTSTPTPSRNNVNCVIGEDGCEQIDDSNTNNDNHGVTCIIGQTCN